MNENKCTFDELEFFAHIKKRPGMYFGQPSLLSLRDFLFGMSLAFGICGYQDKFKYSDLFIDWYTENVIKDQNAYACWWNHMLYVSGGSDRQAFEYFFHRFEIYLSEVHNISLPEVN